MRQRTRITRRAAAASPRSLLRALHPHLACLFVAAAASAAGASTALAEAPASTDDVTVGRYSTVEPKPRPDQSDLWQVIVRVTFPASVHTVGQALERLLARSGYRLAPAAAVGPSVPVLLSRPLPAVHRELGPMTLFDAVTTLAGGMHYVVIDPVHRLASFQLRDRYKRLLAGAREADFRRARATDTAAAAPERAQREQGVKVAAAAPATDSAKPSSPSSETTDAADTQPSYGPIEANDQLWPIAMRMREAMGVDASTERMMLALQRTNPQAFCANAQNNMNCLEPGQSFAAPPRTVIDRIGEDEARRAVRRQNDMWPGLRRAMMDKAAGAQADENEGCGSCR